MKKFFFSFLFLSIFSSQAQIDKEKDSLLYIANHSKNDSLRIVAYNKLFFKEVYSNLEESRNYYKAVFAIAKAKKSNFAYAKAYNLKGVAYDISGNMDSSYIFYNKAIEYARKSKALAVEGSALNNIGLLDWNNGNYYDAIKNYNKALLIFEKTKNVAYQGNVLSNIGLIYDQIDDLKKSEYYLNKAFDIRKNNKDDDYGLSVSYVNLAKLFQKQKKYYKAIEYYKKAIAIKIKLDDLMGLAVAQSNIADVYIDLKEIDKAFDYLKKAEKICLENEAESNILENIYMGFVEVYLTKNQLNLAKVYNQKMLKVNKKTKDIERLSWYYNLDRRIALREKNFQRAYFSGEKADSLSKITSGIELKKSINLFEAKYQSEKKEKELLKIKNKLYIKEIETKRKNTWLIIISVIAFFISVVGYLIYRQQKLKNRQQEQEFELKSAIKEIESQNKLQEQRLNISRDLHDNIGAQLTFIISSVDTIKYAFDLKNTKLSEKLESINQFTKDTIIELRDTIWAMNNTEITFEELRSRILNFIEKARESKDEIDFKFTIDERLNHHILSSVVAMNIYRTIQEAINNAMKYANPKEIKVAVNSVKDCIEISISDNGNGFDTEKTTLGNGLHNMKKRADEINSVITINSASANGTQISLKIPIKNT